MVQGGAAQKFANGLHVIIKQVDGCIMREPGGKYQRKIKCGRWSYY